MSESKRKKFGWAFIGAGDIAHKVASEIVREGSGRIVSVWNRTASRAQSFAAAFSATAFRTPEEALAAPGVEGRLYLRQSRLSRGVCAPLHRSGGTRPEREAVHSQCGEAASLFDFARGKGVYLSEAMWTWHNAAARKVREWIHSGAIGRVRSLRAVYAFPLILMKCRGRLLSAEAGGGALLDIGIYPVRYVYELFGMPDSLSCRGKLRAAESTLGKRSRCATPRSLPRSPYPCLRGAGRRWSSAASAARSSYRSFMPRGGLCFPSEGAREVFRDGALNMRGQFAQVADEIRAGRQEGERIPAQSTVDVLRLTVPSAAAGWECVTHRRSEGLSGRRLGRGISLSQKQGSGPPPCGGLFCRDRGGRVGS